MVLWVGVPCSASSSLGQGERIRRYTRSLLGVSIPGRRKGDQPCAAAHAAPLKVPSGEKVLGRYEKGEDTTTRTKKDSGGAVVHVVPSRHGVLAAINVLENDSVGRWSLPWVGMGRRA